MSGIDLLLKGAAEYERTHQLVLLSLLKDTDLALHLFKIPRPQRVQWEVERGLFDLACDSDLFIELKVWSSLGDDQIRRQSEFLHKKSAAVAYIMLGTSWFEHSEADLKEAVSQRALKIGPTELVSSLNQILIAKNQNPDVVDLVRAYRDSIQNSIDRSLTACENLATGKQYFYSLYHRHRQFLNEAGIGTSIYTVNNPGGEHYVLNIKPWAVKTVQEGQLEVFAELYHAELCIKFRLQNPSSAAKISVRDRIRNSARQVLGNSIQLIDAGKVGKFMTAAKVKHDFKDLAALETSSSLINQIALSLPKIVSLL